MITIGIDPHKSSHTAVALDATGRAVGELRVAATKTTLERLLRWAERWPDRIWAVEGATGLAVPPVQKPQRLWLNRRKPYLLRMPPARA